MTSPESQESPESTKNSRSPKLPVKPIPKGLHSVTPYLVVKDAAKAIAFYEAAFGAREMYRITSPPGVVGHAELQIGDSRIMLADEFPDMGILSAESLGGTGVIIGLYVPDVDAFFARAAEHGAKVLYPVADQFYGDRGGRLADPFGHVWIVSTHKEDVSVDEMQRRANALYG